LRLVGERARNGDALLLPAGKLRRIFRAVFFEVNEFDKAINRFLDFLAAAPAYAQAVADVFSTVMRGKSA